MTTKTEITKQQKIATLIQAELAEHGLEDVVVRPTPQGYMEKISINPIDKSPSDVRVVEAIADKYRLKEGDESTDTKIEYILVSPNYTDDIRQNALNALTDTYDLPRENIDKTTQFVEIKGKKVNVLKTVSDILRGLNEEVVFWEEAEVTA